jgi:predicted nucleotidyltransferase
MGRSTRHLEIAESFARWTKERLGTQLARVVLFGSVARGDDSAASDIDLLIEVRGDPVAVRRLLGPRIMEIAAQDGVFISAFVRPAAEEEMAKGTGIYRTVSKEGRVLG